MQTHRAWAQLFHLFTSQVWSAAATVAQEPDLLLQDLPGRRTLGPDREQPGAGLQAVRANPRGVAGPGLLPFPAKGLRIRYLRTGTKKCI